MNINMPRYDSREDTVTHIRKVAEYLHIFVDDIRARIVAIDAVRETLKGSERLVVTTAGTMSSYPEKMVGGIPAFNLIDILELYARSLHLLKIGADPTKLSIHHVFNPIERTALYTIICNTIPAGEHTASNILTLIADELEDRAIVHDASKLESPEKEILDKYTPMLKHLTYGSAQYTATLAKMAPMLDHHYSHNKNHHPDLHLNGVSDMSLIDMIEMVSDWSAATTRHLDGNIHKSIEVNNVRFKMGNILAGIFENTVSDFQIGQNV